MNHIEVRAVTKTFDRHTVLDNVSLSVAKGRCIGLVGANGSGKTMLMRTMAGLIYPTGGAVKINGKTLGKDISFPPSMGLLIENPAFLRGYTGLENLEILAKVQGGVPQDEIRATLEQVGLDPDDKRKYYKYSLGMRQRLGIAAAIMGKPDIILLDEPINAIDAEGVSVIRDAIRALMDDERIIIIACHDKEEMEYMADTVLHMSEGRLEEEA